MTITNSINSDPLLTPPLSKESDGRTPSPSPSSSTVYSIDSEWQELNGMIANNQQNSIINNNNNNNNDQSPPVFDISELLLSIAQSTVALSETILGATYRFFSLLITTLLFKSPLQFLLLVWSYIVSFIQGTVALLILGILLGVAIVDDLKRRSHGHWFRYLCHALFIERLPHRHFIDFVRAEGYYCEKYSVITKDDYHLSVYAIESKKTKPYRGDILLQHGLFNTAMAFCFTGKHRALAFVLADAGYRVWLGNNRGNIHSRAHASQDPHLSLHYWKFSIDHLVYDVNALYDFILSRQTKNDRQGIIYIGHSQGSTQALMALTQNKLLVDNTRLLICLAPAAYVNESAMNAGLRWMSKLYQNYPSIFYACIGRGAFFPLLEHMRELMAPRVWMYFSGVMFNFLFNWSTELWPNNAKPRYFHETPSYSSIDNVLHWMQMAAHGKFAKFVDLETIESSNRLGALMNAEELPLSHITCPVLLVFGGRDKLIDPHKLATKLPNVIDKIEIAAHYHLDALSAEDAPISLYPLLLKTMETYAK